MNAKIKNWHKTEVGSAPLGTRFARLGRFPMGRAHPQGAATRLCVKMLHDYKRAKIW